MRSVLIEEKGRETVVAKDAIVGQLYEIVKHPFGYLGLIVLITGRGDIKGMTALWGDESDSVTWWNNIANLNNVELRRLTTGSTITITQTP